MVGLGCLRLQLRLERLLPRSWKLLVGECERDWKEDLRSGNGTSDESEEDEDAV